MGLPGLYKPYLRISPLVCAVDAIMVIVRLVAYCIMLRFSPRKAIVLLMESRFEDAEPTENSKAMMSFTWMRWLFFILGPLQMSIKLASFQGMTITKTIGFTYLASFILIELLNLIYSMGRSSADMNSHGDMVGFHGPKHISGPYRDLDRVLSRNGEFCAWTVIILQSYTIVFFILYSFFIPIWDNATSDVVSTYIIHFGVAGGMLTLQILIRYSFLPHMAYICRQYPRLRDNLRLMSTHTTRRWNGELDKGADENAAAIILFFYVNLVTRVCGYALIYDPVGNANPQWTVIFW